jgi:hypothetical protein
MIIPTKLLYLMGRIIVLGDKGSHFTFVFNSEHNTGNILREIHTQIHGVVGFNE